MKGIPHQSVKPEKMKITIIIITILSHVHTCTIPDYRIRLVLLVLIESEVMESVSGQQP